MIYEDICRVVMPLGRVSNNGIQLLGTSFLLNKDGLWGTVAHITGNDDRNLAIILPKIGFTSDYQDTSDIRVQMTHVKISKIDPIHDTVVLKADSVGHSNLMIGTLDAVMVGDSLTICGFPHADQGRMVLTLQHAELGAKVLIDSGGIKAKHGILNIQARPGQSGSPVIHVKTMQLVAILVGSYAPGGGGGISLGGVDPHTLHQTTHAISSEYLKEMI